MRQLSRNIDGRTREGKVKLEAKDGEDMWHLYNLLSPGDFLRAPTIRKVQQESTTGSAQSDRVRLTLTVEVVSVAYDAAGAGIRVRGKNVTENPHVRIGAFHTIELEPHRAFTIGKKEWDSVFIERLDLAVNPATDADLAAVVMQEGLAHVLLVSRSLTLTRARVETAIPRKGKNALYNRESAMGKFFDAVMQAVVQHIDLEAVKVLLIASPGYVKDEFYKHFLAEAVRQDLRAVIDNKQKIVLTHASSGHRHAFHEVLEKPELQARLSQTKAVSEVRALQAFYQMLSDDENRAVYGPPHVLYAAGMGAIGTLLITDELFRSVDIPTRKKYVALVEDVKGAGAEVVVFSAQHVTGKRLGEMTGLAAILRFPIPDIDDIVPEEGEEEEADADKAA